MCLYIKQTFSKVAEKDIVVYKVLDYNMGSPYYGLLYHLNRKVTSKLRIYYTKWEKAMVEEGLHAFSKRLPAYALAQSLERAEGRIYSVYKAIIPKGSKYYIGEDDEIASAALIVKRKLWFNLFQYVQT